MACHIGQTKGTLSDRIIQHYKEKKSYIGRALRKYGKENFSWYILCECSSKKELDDREKFYIQEYNTRINGYNLTNGGDGVHGWVPSEETRKKISEANKGQIPWIKGKHQTKDHIKKRIEATRRKLKGRKRKPFSEETRKKMSEARKRNWENVEYRKYHTERMKGNKYGIR